MKKEPVYGDFPPPKNCQRCEGRGEVEDQLVGFLSSYWTYKKCLSCNGTGKNLWKCMWCDNPVQSGWSFWCPNENCEKYAVNVALAKKED